MNLFGVLHHWTKVYGQNSSTHVQKEKKMARPFIVLPVRRMICKHFKYLLRIRVHCMYNM